MIRDLAAGLFILFIFTIIFIFYGRFSATKTNPDLRSAPPRQKTLEEYSYPNLKSRNYLGSPIKLERIIKEESDYESYLFSYFSENKKITGQANLPRPKSSKATENKFQ